MNNIRVMIAAGGTGGHIFPALALAEELRTRNPDTEILCVGTNRGLEEKIFVGNGFPLRIMHARGLIRSWAPADIFKNLFLPFTLVGVMINARRIVRQFKPHAVIGCGGYVTGPVLLAAALQRIPTLIQEQNSRPGRTTVWLSHVVDEVHLTYEESRKFFRHHDKLMVSGNPVRQGMKPIDRGRAAGVFGLDPDKKILLVVGGSLGARSINRAIDAMAGSLTETCQVLWQTGKVEFDSLADRHSRNPNIRIHAFLDDMIAAYSAADLIVCRAGAMTLSELTMMGKPAVLVPYPYAADNHQEYNAMSLVQRDAAVMIRDHEIGGQLKPILMKLLDDDRRRSEMAARSFELRRPNAAAAIIDAMMKRIN